MLSILGVAQRQLHDGFWAAAAVGFIARNNASISGAEVGCQGEIGVASAMAAAMATYIRTGAMKRVANAAEILRMDSHSARPPIPGYRRHSKIAKPAQKTGAGNGVVISGFS